MTGPAKKQLKRAKPQKRCVKPTKTEPKHSRNMSQPNRPPGESNGGRTEEATNVDRIRDIIFGGQMRDYESKFVQFEERLSRETSDLREDLKHRLTSLETYVKSELSALTDQLSTEKDERNQAIKSVGSEIKEHVKAWEKRCHQTESQNDKAHREIREQTLSEANRLAEEINSKTREIASALDRESKRLSSTLVNRQELSEFFAQMAVHLRGDTSESRAK